MKTQANNRSPDALPRNSLRREIAAALSVKAILLFGLWLLIVRSDNDKPPTQPDVARRLLAPPAAMGLAGPEAPLRSDPHSTTRPLTQETRHVR